MWTMLAVAIGSGLSVLTVFAALRALMRAYEIRSRLAVRVAIWAAVISFPFAWFAGFILGGTYGGGIASAWGEGHGAGVISTVLGIGVGLFVVTTAAVLITSWLSFVVAKAIGEPTNIR